MGLFVHLHNHSDGSTSDSILKPEVMAQKAKDFGQPAIALTDHGVMFKCMEFYKACKKVGIKPIIGMETYVAPRVNTMKDGKNDSANYHLVLLAETDEGYHNLINIASDASINGFYYKPRTDKHKLKKWHEGIICLSACAGGEVQSFLLNNEYDKAKETALMYNDIFGMNNFFLELQNHGNEYDKVVIDGLTRIHNETGIPLVCTNDCHYAEPSHYEAHDVLMCIRDNSKFTDEKRFRYDSDQYYLKSSEEMTELFSAYPDAIENTVKIAERCNIEIEFGKNKLPPFDVPDGYTSRTYLEKLVYDGAKERYGEITDKIDERIQYEISIVDKMGYLEYFLIVWDFMKFAREHGILNGPGRGSGAGSIMAYCLYITHLDPLKYNLLFERFLDPSRVTMPDFDIDWQDNRRYEAIEYVNQKYGRDSVCQIITFNNLKARGVVRAVARVLDYPTAFQDKIAKLIPFNPKMTIELAFEQSPEFKQLYDTDKDVKRVVDIAKVLEGVSTSTGTHAAGVLITDKKGVTAHVPVWKNDSGIVAQYDKDILEELGLLKMDFLGLSTLTVISNAINSIKRNHDVDVDLQELYQCKDQKPFELIAQGKTEGLFQLESAGMTQFMREFCPTSLEDLTAGVALYRPGPMQYIPQFLNNKRNPSLVTYAFPELEPILKETYGLLCYQEQCMQTVIALAGYKKHHSDSFRRAIAKKKAKLIEQHREYFTVGRPEIKDDDGNIIQDAIPGAYALGRDKEKIDKLYSEMEEFGKYSFNKSHAACYAAICYATTWLKYYYPAEFMAALITQQQSSKSANYHIKIARYIKEAQDMNVKILPPSINNSFANTEAIDSTTIAQSLSTKDVDKDSIQSVLTAREQGKFVSMDDFFKRCPSINKKAISSWICIGAFDELGIVRSQYLASLDKIKKAISSVAAAQKSGRKTTVTWENKVVLEKLVAGDLAELPDETKFVLEKAYSGIYQTGHPLDKYAASIVKMKAVPLSILDYDIDDETGSITMINKSVKNGQNIVVACVITEIYNTVTRKDKQPMAIINIEDKSSASKALLFPDQYLKFKSVLDDTKVYKIEGNVKFDSENAPVIIIANIEPISASIIDRIVIKCNDAIELQSVFNHLKTFKSTQEDLTPVYIEVGHMRILLDSDYWVDKQTFQRFNLIQDKIEYSKW